MYRCKVCFREYNADDKEFDILTLLCHRCKKLLEDMVEEMLDGVRY